MGRKTSAVSIIGGADGPTSVFLAGKTKGKRSIRRRFQEYFYRKRKERIKRRIHAGSHTLAETISYIEEKYHGTEVSQESYNYAEQRNCLRESLILTRQPELLGDLAKISSPENFDEEAVKEFLQKQKLRSERVRSMGEEKFPLDYHLYEFPVVEGGKIEVMAEFNWKQFGVSYSGDKRLRKRMRKIFREIYLYYGVSEEDIRVQSERYSALVAALCM